MTVEFSANNSLNLDVSVISSMNDINLGQASASFLESMYCFAPAGLSPMEYSSRMPASTNYELNWQPEYHPERRVTTLSRFVHP